VERRKISGPKAFQSLPIVPIGSESSSSFPWKRTIPLDSLLNKTRSPVRISSIKQGNLISGGVGGVSVMIEIMV